MKSIAIISVALSALLLSACGGGGGGSGTTTGNVTLQPVVNYTCQDTVVWQGKTFSVKSGNSGSIVFDCNTLSWSFSDAMNIVFASVNITENVTMTDSKGTLTGTKTFDSATGKVTYSGTHSAYGSISCFDTYNTPFPLAVTNDDDAIDEAIFWDLDEQKVSTTCPEWMEDEEDETLPNSFESVDNITVLDTTGTQHQIALYQSYK